MRPSRLLNQIVYKSQEKMVYAQITASLCILKVRMAICTGRSLSIYNEAVIRRSLRLRSRSTYDIRLRTGPAVFVLRIMKPAVICTRTSPSDKSGFL